MSISKTRLSSRQPAAALDWGAPREQGFWWCLAVIVVTGLFTVGVSFWLAFKLAASARVVLDADRRRIGVALRRRLRARPVSFLWPR